MKTLIDVKKEIENIKWDIGQMCKVDDKAKINRLKKRVAWLNQVILYLEKEPDAEYLRKTKLRLIVSIDAHTKVGPLDNRNQLIDRATTNPELKKEIVKYDRESGIKKMKDQIRFINYILN